jgi:hypothetical protein
MGFRRAAVLVCALAMYPCAASGQGDSPACSDDPFPLPATVTVRPAPPPTTAGAADCDIAAGLDAEVTATNSGFALRCKSGAPHPGATGTVPLFGDGLDLNEAMFQQTPSLAGDPYSQMYDSKVLYDGFADRFWIVTLESGLEPDPDDPEGPQWAGGRVHIAVSTTGSPDNFSWAPCPLDPLHPECAGSWYKYTEAGTAPPFNLRSAGHPGDRFVLNSLPDVASMAVDETHLYLAIREGEQDMDPNDDRTLIVVAKKDKFLAGDPGDPPAIEMRKFVDAGVTPRWGHQLAVDHDIENGGQSKVYMICQPTVPATGQAYTSIRLGTFRKTNPNNPNSWTYQATNLSLPTAVRYRGASSSAPGGDGDTNHINASLFRGAMTRLVNGDRKVYAVHHVRPTDINDVVARVQSYEVDPNNYPDGVPTVLTTDTVHRLDLSPAWGHDPSIGVNSCGDRAVSFTKAVGESGYPEFWVWLDPASGGDTVALVAEGPEQYYTTGGQFWADYSGTVTDPTDDSLYWGHSVLVHDDGVGVSSEQWESVIASYSMHSCGERPGSDFDGDGDVGLFDLLAFRALYQRQDLGADLNADDNVDVMDALQMLHDERQ